LAKKCESPGDVVHAFGISDLRACHARIRAARTTTDATTTVGTMARLAKLGTDHLHTLMGRIALVSDGAQGRGDRRGVGLWELRARSLIRLLPDSTAAARRRRHRQCHGCNLQHPPPPPPPLTNPPYPLQPSPEEFVAAFKSAFAVRGDPGLIDFGAAGLAFSRVMADVPMWRPLLGPMEVPPKPPKVVVRQKRAMDATHKVNLDAASAAAAEASNVAAAEGANAARFSEMAHQLLELQSGKHPRSADVLGTVVLQDAAPARDDDSDGDAGGGGGGSSRKVQALRMIATLFDPWSYSQTVSQCAWGRQDACTVVSDPSTTTLRRPVLLCCVVQVENLFYASFLYKQGTLTLHVDSGGELWMRYDVPVKGGGGADGGDGGGKRGGGLRYRAHQFVVHVDMQSWDKLVRARKLTQPVLHHRKSKDSTAPASWAFYSPGGLPSKAPGTGSAASGVDVGVDVGRKRKRGESEGSVDGADAGAAAGAASGDNKRRRT